VKKVLVVIGLVVVVLVAAILVGPSLIDLNRYKTEIAAAAEAATGRRLTIEGDLSARLLPSPEVTARGITFANIAGAENPVMVRLRAVEVQAAFWPLLTGTIEVKSVRLIEPVVALETLADGRTSWSFATTASPQTPTGGSGDGGSASGGPSVLLERLSITNGSVSYRDAASGTREQLEKIDLEVTAGDLTAGPFAAKGKLVVRGQPATLDVSVGKLAGAVPLSVSLELDRARLAAKLRGTLSEASVKGRFNGRFDIDAPDLRGAMAGLGSLLQTDLPAPPGAQALQWRSAIEGGIQGVSLTDLALTLGETRGGGTVTAALSPKLSLDVALRFGRLDVDPWLTATPSAAGSPGVPVRPQAPATTSERSAAAMPALPKDLTATVDVSIDALGLRGATVRHARVEGALRDGVLEFKNLSAELPGNATIALSGRLVGPGPQFDGRVEALAADLRGVLGWLNVSTDRAPADRLRQFSFQSAVKVTPELVQLAGLDLRLDSARVTGGAAYALRARPSFSVDLTMDRLNADAYMALAAPASGGSSAPRPAATAPSAPARGAGADPLGLAFLNDVDAAVKIAIQQFAYAQTRGRDLRVDASLIGGRVTIRDARVAELAGASLAVTGTAENFAAVPSFNLAASAAANSPAGVARLFGVTLPVADAQLGQVSVQGTVRGNLGQVTVDLDSRVGRMTAKVNGAVELTAAAPRGDVTFALSDPSYVHLSRLVGAAIAPVAPSSDGPIELKGSLKGGSDSLNVDLGIKVANADVTAAGIVRGLAGAPTFGLATKARHPDLQQFLRALGVDYRPAATNLGALRFAADISGSASEVKVASLDAGFGPVNMTGEVALRTDGPRPKVSGNLSASEILLDLFMPRASPAGALPSATARPAPGAAARPQERWSREPLDLSVLRTFDADLNLRARGLTYGPYAFAEPTLAIKLSDGTLNVDPLTGKLFDGTATLKLVATTAGAAPRLTTTINLTGANIERALKEAAGVGDVTGRFDMAGELATTGRSQFEMISALGGRATFAARQGIVRGIDLRALSDRLKRLNEITDFLGLIQATMNGGQTAYSTLQGSFMIDKGVARSNDFLAQLDAAQGTGTAVVDLPNWQVDLRTRARLTEHADSPQIGLDLTGTLDNPKRDIKTAELEQFLTARGVGALLRRLLPRDAQPAQTGPAQQRQPQTEQPQQQQPQRARPEDVLRGILRR